MELAVNSSWKSEAYRVLQKHANDPYYPKALYTYELVAQVEKLSVRELTELAGQWGGGGKLRSQFLNYIKQCNCLCWHSWKSAWKDFSDYMNEGKIKMQWDKKDPRLEAFIDLYNEQVVKRQWDAAYGSAIAIADLYQDRSREIRENIVAPLYTGVVNRAMMAAEARMKVKKGKK